VTTPLRRLPVPLAEPPYDDGSPTTFSSDDDRNAATSTVTGGTGPGAALRGSGSPGGRGTAAGGPLPSARPTAAAEHEAVQGTLALAFMLPSGLTAAPAPPRLRLVSTEAPTSTDVRDGNNSTDADGRVGTPADAVGRPAHLARPSTTPGTLPDARQWAGRFVQALVEVLAGSRPASQLVRWTDDGVYTEVQRLAGAADADVRGQGAARPVVRSVHLFEPTSGIAEVCAVVHRGGRAAAVAVRMESLDGRWKCTALGLP
jgi:hypothetical protein